MQKEKNISTQEVISMTEDKRTEEKKIRRQIQKRKKPCLDDGRALCMRC